MTPPPERQRLLRVARQAIAAHLTAPSAADSGARAAGAWAATARMGGAFVTLHRGRELRGCIGRVEADEPLEGVIARCAVAAATADPRFPPVGAAELAELSIELSLVGPLEPVTDLSSIEVGRHGLVVEMGYRRGLLLPQVATEWAWDRDAFLAHTCEKAGLARDAWRHGAKVWRFEAEVFGDLHQSEARSL